MGLLLLERSATIILAPESIPVEDWRERVQEPTRRCRGLLMADSGWIATLLFVIEEGIRLSFSVRVIMRRQPVGVSLAWLSVILIFPFFGAATYLLLGEYRLGSRRQTRIRSIQGLWSNLVNTAFPDCHCHVYPNFPETAGLARLSKKLLNSPVIQGNSIELISTTGGVFDAVIRDIESARESLDFEFYIWNEGGRVDEVAEALLRAVQRGVKVRILVDALGSSAFLKGQQIQQLRAGGVQVVGALPAGLLTAPFVRPDLRLHRKIITIDGEIGYTGSMNMADPRFFKKEANVGEWVDAMARVQGPCVQMLRGNFLSAWCIETGESMDLEDWGRALEAAERKGEADIQVLPSGPSISSEAIEHILLTAIYAANQELILTTPYFVPSESLMSALISAAGAGVDVTLIVPAKNDHLLVQYASEAFRRDLAAEGIKVALYDGGLLHTKSITIDRHLSLFGSLNLDPRSLKLNFELTLAVYNEQFTEELRALQLSYLEESRLMLPLDPMAMPMHARFVENTVRLFSPLL